MQPQINFKKNIDFLASNNLVQNELWISNILDLKMPYLVILFLQCMVFLHFDSVNLHVLVNLLYLYFCSRYSIKSI